MYNSSGRSVQFGAVRVFNSRGQCVQFDAAYARIEDQIEIIEKFDQNPSGILIYKGKIYERPHIENMKSIVKKHFRNKSE